MDGHVIGRTDDLAAIEALLEAALDGPAALVIEGRPGIGKTTLVHAAIAAAGRRGARVLSCTATETGRRRPHRSLADLLDGAGADVVGELPPPQRDALGAALGRAGAGEGGDLRALATGALALLEALAEERPVVVAIDDLQWLDPPSARVLEFCFRRLAGRVGLVASRGIGGAGDAEPALTLRELQRLDVRRLAPLDAVALGQVLSRKTDRMPPRTTLERIHAACAGNVFQAAELARALPACGPAPPALPLPAELEKTAMTQLTRLTPDLEEVLLAVAAMAEPTVELVERTLGTSAEAALEAAEERGILERHGHRLRYVHPLLASAVYSRASGERARHMHRRLSEVVPGVDERARHLAHAGVSLALPALDYAANRARAGTTPAAAAELLELALDLERDAARQVRAAEHHLDAGDAPRARALLERAVPSLPGGPARAEALMLLAETRYHDESCTEALGLLEQASQEPGTDRRLRAMIDLRLAFVLCNVRTVAAAEAPVRAAIAAAQDLGDDALLAQGLALLASVDFALGRGGPETSLIRRALDLEHPDVRTASVLRPSLVAAVMHLWSGRLSDCRALLRQVRDRHGDRGEEFEVARMCLALVWLECLRGDLDAARRAADLAVERLLALNTDNARGLGLAARAHVEAHAGHADAAREAGTEALRLFERAGWRTASWRALATLGFLDLSLDDHESAAARLGPETLAAASDGLLTPATWGGGLSYGDAVEALAGTGRVEEAELIATVLERRGRAAGAAWPAAVAVRCRGLILAARGDLAGAEEALRRSVAMQERLPMPLERARGLLALGRVQRRRRRRSAAQATLDRALTAFEAIGSPLWAQRARDELARAGRRSGDARRLTPSEERVARLAASGLKNREVAAHLHFSPKTVEVYLGRAYRKLGIRSRAELGARMAREVTSAGVA